MLITSLFARHVLATNPLRECFYEMVNQTVISVNGDKKIDLKVTSISVKNFNNFSMFSQGTKVWSLCFAYDATVRRSFNYIYRQLQVIFQFSGKFCGKYLH